MPRPLVRHKSLPALDTAALSSDTVDKSQQNGSAACARYPGFDPGHSKPFEHGFLREVVERAVVQGSGKQMLDVYYHTPDGRKLRSRREVADYLARCSKPFPLMLDNFTFARMPIHHPPLEMVRQAGRRRNNKDAASLPPGAPVPPTSAKALTSSTASTSASLLGSTTKEPVATAEALCANREGGLTVRRSARKQCLCCEGSSSSRKRLRATQSTHPAQIPPAKSPRRSTSVDSTHQHLDLPTKPKTATARLFGAPPRRGSSLPKVSKNDKPTMSRGPGRPPKQQSRLQGRSLPPARNFPMAAKSASGKKRGAMSEPGQRAVPQPSLPGSFHSGCDARGTPEDSAGGSASSDDGALESSPKRAFVLLKDVLRTETGPEPPPDLGANTAMRSRSENAGPVAPITLKAHVRPWQSLAAWEIYEVLQTRQNAGNVADNKKDKSSLLQRGRGAKMPHSSRKGKGGYEEEEGCAADLVEVLLPETDAASSAASEQSPTQASATVWHHPRRPAVTAKANLTDSGLPPSVCGVNCPRALGQTPQLLCTRCLCHFHPVCVGLMDIHPHVTRGTFVCKPCSKQSRRAGVGSQSTHTQLILPRAAPGAKPSQAQGLNTTLIAPTVASTALFVPSTTCPSLVTSVSSVLPMVGNPLSTSTVPVVHVMPAAGHSNMQPPLQFVCNPAESQSTGLLPPPLAVCMPSTSSIRVNPQPHMPALIAAPRPSNSASLIAATVRPAGMPTLRLQPTASQNLTGISTHYYAIHLNQRLSDIDMPALVSLVQQAAQKGPAELQKVCSRQGIVLQTGTPALQLLQTAEAVQQTTVPSSFLSQTTAAPQAIASVSQLAACNVHSAVVAAHLTSTSAPQPVSGKKWVPPSGQPSVLKTSHILSETLSALCSATSDESKPTSAASLQPTADIVSARKPEPGNVPLVIQGQQAALQQAPSSGACINSQPAVTSSVCVAVATVVPKTEPKTDKARLLGTNHQTSLPKQLSGMQAGSGKEPNDTDNVTSSKGNDAVRAAATSVPQETTDTAGVTTRTDERMETAAEESETPMATFCKIENVISMAASEKEWPLASDGSEGESRLVIIEDADDGSSDHADDPSPSKKQGNKTSLDSKTAKQSDSSLPEAAWQLCVPQTPPIDSGHSAQATNSEQGPSDIVAASPSSRASSVEAPCSRKTARIKRVKRRVPEGASGCLSSSLTGAPIIWMRTQQQLVCVRDRTTIDPLALHRDPVPNSAQMFSDLASGIMALDKVFSWLPLPSLCRAAQVCKAWNIAANSPYLWKQIDFRQFRVRNWDTCLMKLRPRCPEELVLDGESLDHLLPYAEQLDTVERLSLVVNSRQLACVARAFPALRSLQATVMRKGSGAVASQSGEGGEDPPQRQASLGCLTELLCIKGLERLDLRGAHGLALLPLTMTPTSLALRCQQLRVLSLTTVQVVNPVVVFPISLLRQLEELHLGNCTNWSNASFVNIGQLKHLRRLTLECGEDGPGFHTMLLKLNRLERLELKRWTLRESLSDVLPCMEQLRSLLLWPQTSCLASRSRRNALRSCLSAGAGLERLTWVVGCKQVVRVSSAGVSKAQSLSPDIRFAIEAGTLCGCQPPTTAPSQSHSIPASSFLDVSGSPSKAAETVTCASPNTRGRKITADISAGNTSGSSPSSSAASKCASPLKSGAASGSAPSSPQNSRSRKLVNGSAFDRDCAGTSAVGYSTAAENASVSPRKEPRARKNASPSALPTTTTAATLSSPSTQLQMGEASTSEQKESVSSSEVPPNTSPETPCCALAKKILEVWNPSLEGTWHVTLRQFCHGLQHCMGPRTAVCVCLRVEP